MFWRIAEAIEPSKLKRVCYGAFHPAPNLWGDRDIEYSWVASNIPDGPGEALDFGCGPSWMGLLAARKGFHVRGIDLEPPSWPYHYSGLEFTQGDIFHLNLPAASFDLVINCSAVEHVGLAGRYGVREARPDGDLEAMAILKGVLRPEKVMILTTPVGCHSVFTPLHRVYGRERLPKLLAGWRIRKKEFWIKDKNNRWICVDEAPALEFEPARHRYGLGLFLLSS